jgi:hypothetical protein
VQAARDLVEKLRREVWPPTPEHGGAQVADRDAKISTTVCWRSRSILYYIVGS